jgi:hypothetical protein
MMRGAHRLFGSVAARGGGGNGEMVVVSLLGLFVEAGLFFFERRDLHGKEGRAGGRGGKS